MHGLPEPLTPQLLLRAYANGYFPMAESAEDPNYFWVHPERRGVLPLDRFHLPRSLAKTIRGKTFTVTVDTDFAAVMRACAEPHGPARRETWINRPILHAYTALHRAGHAHSVECRDASGSLVGGLYGVRLGGAFFGESMFSRATDSSKVALAYLVARLIMGGFSLLDTQFLTSHLARFGAIEIPRDLYMQRVDDAMQFDGDFSRLPKDADAETVLAILRQPTKPTET